MLRGCLQHLSEISSFSAVQPAPFSIFTDKAMVMIKPTPDPIASIGSTNIRTFAHDMAVVQRINGELKVKTEGKLSWLFMNKSAEGSTGKTYDKQSLLSISLNAAKAAEILTLSPAAGGTINPSAFSKGGPQSLSFSPVTKPADGETEAKQAVHIVATKAAQRIEIDATPGELKAMQVLIESVLPALYGWRLNPVSEAANESQGNNAPPAPSVDDFFS
ncbi:hypothetical protein Pmar_PMAR028198 [Perkinsus marinus ATCC 50983]|uniref:Uncharacterized protein n=1 Tax=Perkinsus marinus (strain ATCC 50983 / TXsc) TaxID=423536 RepID=C5LB82_PERM5|nr:hypothetical protein Pmar_PMAR028198 [Perkinsus marinus ATCC 50983]EER06010.1 hypothetical protein Pmar_PMAR028198 [Perkinsus marinus ATCC 50983]|eukprot:XP_002774194.1 hypothetical protein Pmar_PMAR028198 [Perkinsus marinus ATCC 50983]